MARKIKFDLSLRSGDMLRQMRKKREQTFWFRIIEFFFRGSRKSFTRTFRSSTLALEIVENIY